jgi:hypothetical protein
MHLTLARILIKLLYIDITPALTYIAHTGNNNNKRKEYYA